MSSLTIFKGTPSERTVTPEEVENLYKHALDAFDELNVYKEVHENGVFSYELQIQQLNVHYRT